MSRTEPQPAPPDATSAEIRLVNDESLDGAINMARDEALLDGVRSGTSPATLRLYEWAAPTVSLGYFQPYAQYETLAPPAGELPVVRRLTGGGAILHDRELTYSLVLPTSHTLANAKPNRLYELGHGTIVTCLAERGVIATPCGHDDASTPTKGPFFCFARRHRCDLLIAGDKVAGSAQRRTREAVLQHGSVIIERRFDQQPAAELAPLGIDAALLRERLPILLSDALKAEITPGAWTDPELHSAESLREKYKGQGWTRRK